MVGHVALASDYIDALDAALNAGTMTPKLQEHYTKSIVSHLSKLDKPFVKQIVEASVDIL